MAGVGFVVVLVGALFVTAIAADVFFREKPPLPTRLLKTVCLVGMALVWSVFVIATIALVWGPPS
jgi:hypothetical protein